MLTSNRASTLSADRHAARAPTCSIIRVLVVDDSPMVRRLISRILTADGDFLVVGFACDGYEALQRVAELDPHVVTLDWNMPGPDGKETLGRVRELFPDVQVLMCSSLTVAGSVMTRVALECGASEFIAKPVGVQTDAGIAQQFAADLCRKLRHMRHALCPDRPSPDAPRANQRKQTAMTPEVFAIGCSTGGPAALSLILPLLPADFPLPVVIVQHMPAHFTALLAKRLAAICSVPVLEAQQGMELRRGTIYIAPGDHHMQLMRKLHRVMVHLSQDPHVNSCRPAVDVLFKSVALIYGGASIVAVLTGMGQDGLQGARNLSDLGARILVQDRDSSVVWGMPGAIAEAGLAEAVLPLQNIIPQVMRLL